MNASGRSFPARFPALAGPDRRTTAASTWHAAVACVLLGLLVGSLDLVFAIGYWAARDIAPERVVQAVAGWVLGREAAFAGGWRTVLLGAGLNYGLMIAIVAGYRIASHRHVRLRERPVLAGGLYGAGVYLLLHVLLLPLLTGQGPDPRLDWQLACLAVYVVLVGIPCGVLAKMASGASPSSGKAGGAAGRR